MRVCFADFFFFQAEDGIRDLTVTGVQTCALPISWSTSRSVRPGGSASGRPSRMSAGTTLSMNSSSDAALTSWSIVRVSSGLGPMWRATKRSAGSREARAVAMVERLFANLLLVLLAPQEVVEFLRTLDPEPDHPALAVGVPVHEGRVTVGRRVDLRDRAGDGGKELRDRLHRLDRPEHVHARERRSDLGQRSEERRVGKEC